MFLCYIQQLLVLVAHLNLPEFPESSCWYVTHRLAKSFINNIPSPTFNSQENSPIQLGGRFCGVVPEIILPDSSLDSSLVLLCVVDEQESLTTGKKEVMLQVFLCFGSAIVFHVYKLTTPTISLW